MMASTALVLSLTLVLSVATQAPAPNGTQPLELRLVPQDVEDGIPGSFTILLVNHSGHDVRLPMPDSNCSDSYNGNVGLSVRYTPLVPAPSMGHGCAADLYSWPPIMERIKDWRVVHSGESLNLLGADKKAYYDGGLPGSYEIWAGYLPPFIDPSDQIILRAAGVDFPQTALTTPHVAFVKKTW
jgi:hypothetical protein